MLIVGLGNVGEKFRNTRHNAGREFVMALQKTAALPEFRCEKKWNAEVSEGKVGKTKVLLLLPDTMMNKSGSAVVLAARFYKEKPKNLVLLHDDADIALGRIKLSFAKRSAGHKGVESVKRALGTWDFWRFRIGIQKKKRVDAMKLVLQKFTPAEEPLLKKIKKRALEGLRILAEEGPEKAMNDCNKS